MPDDISKTIAEYAERIAELEARLAKAVPWDEHAKAVKDVYFEALADSIAEYDILSVCRVAHSFWLQSDARKRLAEREGKEGGAP